MPLEDCIRSSHTTKKLFVIPSLAAQGVEKGHKAINVNWTDVSTLDPPSKTLTDGARYIDDCTK